MNLRTSALTCTALSVVTLFLSLMVPGAEAQQVRHRQLNIAEGLPQSQVLDVHQDSRGYIWVATQGGGVARYDGTDFELFAHGENRSVYVVFEDAQGRMWFGTSDGVDVHDGHTQVHYGGFRSNVINKIRAAPNGEMWIATDSGIEIISAHGDHRHGPAALEGLAVTDLVLDANGLLWIGTDGNGLFTFNGRVVEKRPEVTDPYIRAMHTGPMGSMWIGSRRGLSIRHSNGMVRGIPDPEGHLDDVQTIREDHEGTVWIGTSRGLFAWEGGQLNEYAANVLNDRRVSVIFEDNEHGLWVGTDGHGVFHFPRTPFSYFTEENGLVNNIVWNFARTPDRALWIGTRGGVSRYRSGTFTSWSELDGYPLRDTRALHVDVNGQLWLGTDSGVFRFEDGSFVDIGAPSGVIQVRDLAEAPDGSLWVATFTDGVFHWNGREWRNHSTAHGMLSNRVLALFVDASGAVWMGTNEGLNRWDGARMQSYTPEDGLSFDQILDIDQDASGHIWLATYGGGVNRLRVDAEGTLREVDIFNSERGLSDDATVSLVFDEEEDLWVCTNRGMSELRMTPEPAIHRFGGGPNDTPLECNTDASWKAPDGTLWFGTSTGIARYHPRLDDDDSGMGVEVMLTDIRLFLEDVDWTEYGDSLTAWHGLPVDLTLPHDRNHVRFEFLGISLRAPEAVQYQYFLEGFDADWSPASPERDATYSFLPPGDYTFRVRAAGRDGVWSDTPASFTFAVNAPFWMTLWFRISMFMLGAGLIVFLVDRRVGRYRRQRRLLERRVEQRTKELLAANRDLRLAQQHAEEALKIKSQFVANMSHEIRTPMNGVIGFTSLLLDSKLGKEEREFAEMIKLSSEAMMDVVNQILDFSKLEAGKMEIERVPFVVRDVVQETLDLVLPTAHQKRLELTSVVDSDVPAEWVGDRVRVRQVLLNLVGNAVKFTERGRVEVGVSRLPDGVLQFRVNDSGIGIPGDRLLGLFEAFTQADGSTTRKYGGTGLGLTISKELVELMGGHITVESTPDEGSTFIFTLP
ncbi:MAG: two-component regulator propeller domain-containing protein [Rhodothermales bacterium]